MFQLIVYTLLLAVVKSYSERIAVVQLTSPDVTGTIWFTEVESGVRVNGSIVGLAAGHYGFHIHELGDTSTCDAAGAHFNPDNTVHGGRDHTLRHVGDLGNVQFIGDDSAVAVIDFLDIVIALRGQNNILGRTLILHAQEDDLGLGGHENSLTTGNAGSRVACGVIGIGSVSDSWA